MIRPPPMPVPRKIPTMLRGLPSNSTSCTPSVQTLQSFCKNTGSFSCFSSSFFSATSFQPRLPANITLPFSASTEPGAPMPTPLTCLRFRSHSSTASCTQWAMRSITDSGPRSAFVLILERPDAFQRGGEHAGQNLGAAQIHAHQIFRFAACFGHNLDCSMLRIAPASARSEIICRSARLRSSAATPR